MAGPTTRGSFMTDTGPERPPGAAMLAAAEELFEEVLSGAVKIEVNQT
jgi:hypothetical protein